MIKYLKQFVPCGILGSRCDDFSITEIGASNFERVNYAPGAVILRKAAETAIVALFDGRPSRVELSDREARELLSLFMGSKPLPAAQTRIDVVCHRIKLIEGSFDKLSNLETLVLSRSSIATVEAPLWRRLLRLFFPPRDWRGVGPTGVRSFGTMIAHAAFSDPRLHQAALIGLRKMLKNRLLMQPGETLLKIRLSPPFFWCLLALAMRSSDGRVGDVLQRVAHKAVCDEAVLAVRTVGWAGFWEQWCLKLALTDTPPKEADALVQMLEELPLIRGIKDVPDNVEPDTYEESDSEEDETNWGKIMTYADWMTKAPPFAARLIEGRL